MSRTIYKTKKDKKSNDLSSSNSEDIKKETELPKRNKNVEIYNKKASTLNRNRNNKEEISIKKEYQNEDDEDENLLLIVDSDKEDEEDEEEKTSEKSENDNDNKDNIITEAEFVEGFSLTKAFISLSEEIGKNEIITLKFDDNCITIDEKSINTNIQINITLFGNKLLNYIYNDEYETHIPVSMSELTNKIKTKKNQDLTLKIIKDKKSPFRFSSGDIKDEFIQISKSKQELDEEQKIQNDKEKEYEHNYDTKSIKLKSSTLLKLIKNCSTKNDDHIIIKSWIDRKNNKRITLSGFKKDGSSSFAPKNFNHDYYEENSQNYYKEFKLQKKTIKTIDKQSGMFLTSAISEIFFEEDKPLCIRSSIGLFGKMDIYVYSI